MPLIGVYLGRDFNFSIPSDWNRRRSKTDDGRFVNYGCVGPIAIENLGEHPWNQELWNQLI